MSQRAGDEVFPTVTKPSWSGGKTKFRRETTWPMNRLKRQVLLAATVAICCIGSIPATAQVINYDIPRQDLSKALVALALRSGRNIVFSPRLISGKTSSPVQGALSFAQALDRLLSDAGLSARIQPDGSVVIVAASGPRPSAMRRPPPSPALSSPPAATPAVVVTGRRLRAPEQVARADPGAASLSSSLLEGAPDHNVAEALGQLPGVIVLDGGATATNSVPVDFAGRGEGEFASLRGFDAEFNVTEINGVEAAQSQPYSRGVQLSLLPTTGLSQVVVDKTPTSADDGDAIGGLIDIRTPSAFDFPSGRHLSISLGAQAEDEAARYGRDPYGGSASIEVGRLLGGDQSIGVYAAAYYSAERFSNEVIDGFYPAQSNQMFSYAVQTASGASAPGLDPAANLVLTGLDAGLTTGEIRRYGGDLTLDWRPRAGLTAYARLTLAEADTQQQSYYAQIYGEDITAVPLGASGLYGPMIGAVRPRYYYETNPETAVLDTLQVGGAATEGRLALSANLSAGWGETNDPNHFELSGRQPEVGPALPFNEPALFAATDGAPSLLLSGAQLAAISDFADYGARRAGELTEEFSNQIKYAARFDASYDPGAGDEIAWGLKMSRSRRSHTYRDYTSEALYTTAANDPTLASLGFISGSVRALAPGVINAPAPTFDAAEAVAFFDANVRQAFGSLASTIDTCGVLFVNNFNCDTQHGVETVAAAYLNGRLMLGGLEITPGFRFEHTDITNRFWVIPHASDGAEQPGYFSTNHTTYDEPLPSLRLKLRASSRSVIEAAAWASYVRPAMFQLGGSSQILPTNSGAALGGSTTVIEGNPNLKPVQAINLDLSWTYDDARGGQASIALFHKSLDHFIYDSLAGTFTNLTASQDGGTVIDQPRNGGAGHVYGLELTGRRGFLELAAPFDGLGVGGNLTLEHSSVDTLIGGLDPHERLINQPNEETNLVLFYEKPWGSARLSYRLVGPYVSEYGTLGNTSALDTWVRGSRRLDFQSGVAVGRGWRITLSGSNLLNDRSYAATIGDRAWTIPSLAYTGRTVFLTARWTR